jgi:hypothetical protein
MKAKTVKDPEGRTRYSIQCRWCKARWIEEASHWSECQILHKCPESDIKRELIGTRSLTGIGMVLYSRYDFLTLEFVIEPVTWKPRPDGSVSKCDGRCTGAKGPNCDCFCRGACHGAGTCEPEAHARMELAGRPA